MTLLTKIPLCAQIREMDDYTIKHEPISSAALMERAAGELAKWICSRISTSNRLIIVAGPGNNGGDGLVLARLLVHQGYRCEIVVINLSGRFSADFLLNRQRLEQCNIPYRVVNDVTGVPVFEKGQVIIDALFGSGLSKPCSGLAGAVINAINHSECTVISVDMPSGLFGEDNRSNLSGAIVRADVTLTFQFPKLAFFFPENEEFVGQWHVLSIGLHSEAIKNCKVDNYALTPGYVHQLIRPRRRFAHKGNFGHALLVSGSAGKMGAAILGARSCLRAGAGLLTVHLPGSGYKLMPAAVPEAMYSIDRNKNIITGISTLKPFSAIGVGPGIGRDSKTAGALTQLIRSASVPLVLDADAINIIAGNKKLLNDLPPGTILTPHLKEFERLAGKVSDSYSRMILQRELSRKYSIIIVLKGAYTCISFPDGHCFFNTTGNPGMATGGSGDVLTGIILSFLAQGYGHANASILGVYIHGMAGDMAREKFGEAGVTAGDIADHAGLAIERLLNFTFIGC